MKQLSELWYDAIKSGKKQIEDAPRLLRPRLTAMLEGREFTTEEFIKAITPENATLSNVVENDS